MSIISICLPTLNARDFLEPRIESILSQTLGDWELIVCDSYSDDGTWEYLQQFKNDERIHLHQVPRDGLYAGWNECLKRCRGKYVYVATADDTCKRDFLREMVMAAETYAKCRVCVCDLEFIDEYSKTISCPSNWLARKFYDEYINQSHLRSGLTEFLIQACLGIVWYSMSAVLFRRDLLNDVGFFRLDRGSQADYEWQLRASLSSDVVYIPGQLATWRVHSQQATAGLPKINNTELLCLESVLNDGLMPTEWCHIPGWYDKIIRIRKTEYLDSIGLSRSNIRNNITKFADGFFYSLIHEPKYLVDRIVHGFTYSDKLLYDPMLYTQELISAFNCKWPPSIL